MSLFDEVTTFLV